MPQDSRFQTKFWHQWRYMVILFFSKKAMHACFCELGHCHCFQGHHTLALVMTRSSWHTHHIVAAVAVTSILQQTLANAPSWQTIAFIDLKTFSYILCDYFRCQESTISNANKTVLIVEWFCQEPFVYFGQTMWGLHHGQEVLNTIQVWTIPIVPGMARIWGWLTKLASVWLWFWFL